MDRKRTFWVYPHRQHRQPNLGQFVGVRHVCELQHLAGPDACIGIPIFQHRLQCAFDKRQSQSRYYERYIQILNGIGAAQKSILKKSIIVVSRTFFSGLVHDQTNQMAGLQMPIAFLDLRRL